jgi:hypothetical protein
MELLLRADAIFDNLDFSNLWSEVKTKWPESREGKVVKSGSVRCLFKKKKIYIRIYLNIYQENIYIFLDFLIYYLNICIFICLFAHSRNY